MVIGVNLITRLDMGCLVSNYYLFIQELKPLSDDQILECWKSVCEKIKDCRQHKSIDREIQHRNLGDV